MAQILSVLFEHASGYALFRVKEFEEVGMLIPQVEEAVSKLAKFNSVIKLTAFSPFRSGTNALDNINSISEGVLHEDLHVFLETNFPKPGKKQKFILGVSDNRIAAAITENMSIMCQCTGVVLEIIRGIRLHFPHFIQGLTDKTQVQAQLGLGHSYSRAKVKFNIHRVDNMIIQSISLLDQLDKDINTFSMRIREWYSYHFPELIKLVTDNYSYARVVKTINIRSKITEEKVDQLEEILLDRSKAVAIQNASKMSMGMDISPIDLLNIELFASRVIALAEYRKNLMDYLSTKMTQVAPSLTSLIGEQVGARLIAHAGSLTNLAKYPSSTVQILGAEKALFRALKNKGNTPKYGLIFHSTFIGRAAPKNKGRISRYLANKCSLASRIDCFSDFPNSVFGVHLRMQVEDRLKFYETGTPPQKNVDVMKVALKEFSVLYANFTKKEKKRKKKEKKLSLEMSMALENGEENSIVAEERPKKKRKLAEMEDEPVVPNSVAKVNDDELPKKKKKRKLKGKVGAAEQNPEIEILTEISKEISERIEEETETVSPKKKKNKNKMKGGKLKEPAPTENNINQAKKKKNKKPCKEEIEVMEAEVTFEEKRAKSAKKKKKKKISNF